MQMVKRKLESFNGNCVIFWKFDLIAVNENFYFLSKFSDDKLLSNINFFINLYLLFEFFEKSSLFFSQFIRLINLR